MSCLFELLKFLVLVEAFQSVEGMGSDEGVPVGDVLLPASGLPFAVLLGRVLTIELPDAEVVNALIYKRVEIKSVQASYIFYVCKWLTHCDLIHYKPHLPN